MRRIKGSVNGRILRCNTSILLTPTLGVRQGPLYKHGFRCCSRSPLISNGVTTTCIEKVRDGKIKASVGRFTIGGRRAGQGTGSTHVAPHTLQRVCLGKFRVTIGRSTP